MIFNATYISAYYFKVKIEKIRRKKYSTKKNIKTKKKNMIVNNGDETPCVWVFIVFYKR